MAQEVAEMPRPVPYAHSGRWKLMANSVWNALLIVVTLALVASATLGSGGGARLPQVLLPDMLIYALPAIPLSLLMASGELDLSAAGTAGLAATITALALRDGGSLFGPLATCLALGLVIGAVNGALVGAARLNGALATFATGALLAGVTLAITDATGIVIRPSELEAGAAGALGWAVLLVALLGGVALVYLSPLGQRPQAGDPPEPRLRRSLMVGLPYAACGMLAALAGSLLVVRLRFAGPGITAAYELRLLLAVVVGGTALGRGVSNVFGAVIGAAFSSALALMLTINGIAATAAQFVLGAVLTAAVVLGYVYHGLFGWAVARRNGPEPGMAAADEPAASTDAADGKAESD